MVLSDETQILREKTFCLKRETILIERLEVAEIFIKNWTRRGWYSLLQL